MHRISWYRLSAESTRGTFFILLSHVLYDISFVRGSPPDFSRSGGMPKHSMQILDEMLDVVLGTAGDKLLRTTLAALAVESWAPGCEELYR